MSCHKSRRNAGSTLAWTFLAPMLLLASPSARAENARSAPIDVTLVGGRSETKELEQLLLEWNPTFTVRRSARVNASEVLDSATSSKRLGIWVVVSRPDLARLYFTDPTDSRYFVREVPLTNGLDEPGREILVQVITTSANAFLERRVSSSPAEIEASLDDAAAATSGMRGDAMKAAEARAGVPPGEAAPTLTGNLRLTGVVLQREASPKAAWSWNIGLLYPFTMARDTTVGHGPGTYVGVTRRFGEFGLRTRVEGHYRLPIEQQVKGATLTLHSWALGVSTELTRDLGDGWALGGAIGFTVERTEFGLTRIADAAIEAEPEGRHYRPNVSLAIPCIRDFGGLRVAIVPGLQVALVRTHYDISTLVVYEPWLLQPRLSLELGWEAARQAAH